MRRPEPAPRAFRTDKLAVHATAELKAATYSSLRLLIDQEQLVLPASAEDLRRELLTLRVSFTAGGTEHIEAAAGHDDLADALMLAAMPYRDERGTWQTGLAQLADLRRELPVPDLRLSTGPLVRTGGGLEVPRRPIWLSVAGEEATVPAGARTVESDRRDELAERIRAALNRAHAAQQHAPGGAFDE